jgi:serine/threonine protein phosphatase 1
MSDPGRQTRLLAVGDIHGCHDQLLALLAMVQPGPGDQLVFLGDYIDRGPDSRQVVELLLSLQRRHPHWVFLKGNHEAMLLDFLERGETFPYLINGGDATLESYGAAGIPPEHRAFFIGLRPYYETADFIFVHAGLRPGLPPAEQREEDLLWIREKFLASDYDWGKTVVFGHTPRPSALLTPNRIGLDTGAVYGGRLSCCEVRSRQLWQAGPGLLAP